MTVSFPGGGSTYTAWTERDQDGQVGNDDGVTGVWHNRTLDMSRLATGQLTGVYLSGDQGSTGNWSVDFADIALISADGTVTTLYNGQPVAPSPVGGVGTSNVQQSFSSTAEPNTPGSTRYYVSDQVGTAQLEFSQGGWPLWKGEFAPFGQELDAGNSQNRYKFTGKERDTESGLDYFGARYYGSSMGRFMTPDPSGLDFADASNPQSFNLYSYVLNNPLTFTDPDGLSCSDTGATIDSGVDGGTADPPSCAKADDSTDVVARNKLPHTTDSVTVVAPRAGVDLAYDLDVETARRYLSRINPPRPPDFLTAVVRQIARDTAGFPIPCSVNASLSVGTSNFSVGDELNLRTGARKPVGTFTSPGIGDPNGSGNEFFGNFSASVKDGNLSVGANVRLPGTPLSIGASTSPGKLATLSVGGNFGLLRGKLSVPVGYIGDAKCR